RYRLRHVVFGKRLVGNRLRDRRQRFARWSDIGGGDRRGRLQRRLEPAIDPGKPRTVEVAQANGPTNERNQRKRNQELQRSGEPQPVAHVRSIPAQQVHEQAYKQSEQRRLPKVIENERARLHRHFLLCSSNSFMAASKRSEERRV